MTDNPDRRPPPTSDRLRDDIDHGRAGDKVSFSDPAAAPLGTDAEAAGTPPSPEALARAERAETRRPDDTTGPAHRTPGGLQGERTPPPAGRRGMSSAIIWGTAGLLVLLALIWLF